MTVTNATAVVTGDTSRKMPTTTLAAPQSKTPHLLRLIAAREPPR
jgi:hypothetical protein